jgi:hypothetical protein
MKKLFFLMAALVACVSSFAKSSSETNAPQGLVAYETGMRIAHFDHLRNSFSIDHRPLVCPRPFVGDWDGKCKNEKGESAWQLLEWVIPKGYRILGVQYMMAGAGYRQLIVYFVPEEVK